MDPAVALLALYRQPPLDNAKAPCFGQPDVPTLAASELLNDEVLNAQLMRYRRTATVTPPFSGRRFDMVEISFQRRLDPDAGGQPAIGLRAAGGRG